ncbi:MAG: hypothetical protein JNK35_04760 [Phycisphaerae bacterium]|nr:hypothetical protein [Phycisphaerae bacterium]
MSRGRSGASSLGRWCRAAASLLVCALAWTGGGCERSGGSGGGGGGASAGPGRPASGAAAAAPTNRVDIPIAVRQNLGVTFAKVERRAVARTLRVPGRFEYLPTARREYRAALAGQVEPLVQQYERVEAGRPLFRVASASWRDLHEQIAGTRARVESMGPLREAHRAHEKSLSDKVALWEARLARLEELREAGGGSAALMTEARATLNATQAELADVMEKDAELQAQQHQVEADLRALLTRRDLVLRAAGCEPAGAGTAGGGGAEDATSFTVCALAAGVVEVMAVTPGGLVEASGHVLTVVQPEAVRFRARALQADANRLRDGLPAAAVPAGDAAASDSVPEAMSGALTIAPGADPDARTIDLILTPSRLASWARAGVAAHLEVTLAGTAGPELSIPASAVIRDGLKAVIFRRDPANPDKAIRMEADLGVSDGRWVVIASGVKEGDEVVLGGNYQLMLATSGSAPKGGHFHSDGTFHEGED